MKGFLLYILIPVLWGPAAAAKPDTDTKPQASGQQNNKQTNTQPPEKDKPAEKVEPVVKGPKWDRKTPIDMNTKYADYPYDLRELVDRIDKGDTAYRNRALTPQSRCRGLIQVNRFLLPLMVAFNIGKTFKINGPDKEVLEVKLQTGMHVSRINAYWRQNMRCFGKSLTLMNSEVPRPVLPLFV